MSLRAAEDAGRQLLVSALSREGRPCGSQRPPVLATRVAMTTTQRTGYDYRIDALDEVYRAAEAANSAEASP